jgi:3-hydroxybutyrate dehydrogenase
LKLQNKIALITGGGRGIGRAIAFAFAREGAQVVLLARTKEQVVQTTFEISEECKAEIASWIACDISNSEHVEPAFDHVSKVFGRRPDIVVNNAGISESAPFIKTSDELWRRHLAINLTGTFYFMRAALPAMIERGWGRIINIASIAGKTGAPYISAYAASKHGVLGLTRSAALEVASKGVTVNAICPGYVDTEMTTHALEKIEAKTGKSAQDALEAIKRMSPQNRLITPEEVAEVALLLASEEGRGINGQAINVDGGSILY